jgi:transposase InsO family protein
LVSFDSAVVDPLSLPKTSFGMTECDSCASGRRDVRVPDKLLLVARSRLKSRASLEAENLVLRQQVIVLSRQSRSRVRLRNIDRLIFVWLYRFFPAILNTITVVKPETIIRWHRSGFRAYWRWKSRRCGGRPKIDRESRDLIRRMSKENPLWGAPRIHGELLMLGIEVAQSTVARYMTRRQGPPSQGWKTFLRNHAAGIASIDLFVVRTISFKLLYGLVILRHARRRLVNISVTNNPTAEWIAGQVTDAFPWDEAPRHLIRDRDRAFGVAYIRRIRAMGIRDHPTAPRSPWQNGHVERLIGSIRRESLDHFIVFGEAHLRGVLKAYASYYNEVRTHLSLDKDAPYFRRAQKLGCITAIPILGGLHHQYVRV